ncbi:hypothetical protein AMECASPLE_024331 [Ameca splendens]|uniref:G-protein coupled receptors family 2 profile 2 domain-containing protein n=1 Tax=Ameca splendens TaxID=208324 RepID=A0ABV0YRY3_9TELE
MLVIGFVLGYAAPLIIAVTTMAVTAPFKKYMREDRVCWLNWNNSKALLAFVVPVLLIVAINFIILLVVIYKMLRRRVEMNAAKTGEQHVLVVIARSLAVLTPFFGLTWSLGVGTIIAPKNKEIHFAFSLLNSLQGCFIWMFGTLLDKKVRSETIKSLSSNDKATSA